MAYPNREEAHRLLEEAHGCNPGPWAAHSLVAAQSAQRIAAKCPGLDPEKAYVLGLLHDIGRKFGVKHLAHVYDGYQYMLSLGYDEVARICLTHSFCLNTIDCYIGNFDIPVPLQRELDALLRGITYDIYDCLIQLCDCLAGADGIVDMEVRMNDVRRRYGFYSQEKWERNMALRAMFESLCGENIYTVAGKN